MEATRSQRTRAWLVVVAVVAVALGGWAVFTSAGAGAGDAAGSTSAASTTAPARDDRPPAPDVELATRDGGTVALGDFAGQPLVLNFWASWCPPCVAEMGDALEPAHQEYGDRVAFLGVNLQDEPDAAQRIVDQTGVTYDLALDPDGDAFSAFEGVGMPTTVFIDAQGAIVDRHTGILTPEQLEAQIDRLLEA